MNERLSKVFNHPMRTPVATGIAALGVGIAIGYILGRKRKIELYEVPAQMTFDFSPELREDMEMTIPDEELILRRDNQELVLKRPRLAPPLKSSAEEEVATGEGFVESLLKSVATEPPVEEEPEVITHNVFAGTDDEWDYEEEAKNRGPELPYVLHKDEFYENERDFLQTTLTYYAGDNIMTDEDDKPVYNHGTTIGELKFGHGSGDPNVFYVRNIKNKAEYEIIHDPGLYSIEVLGLEIEDNARVKDLKHSDNKKFRSDD